MTDNDRESEINIDYEFINQFAGMRMTAVQPEFLEEIGRVVANFALLEYELFLLIHGLLGTEPEISRIVTCELSFKNLIELSSSLIKQIHGESVLQKYKEILKAVIEADEKRNLVVHSQWGSAQTHIIRSKTTAKRAKGLNVQREKYTKADLENVVLVISKAILSVEIFRKQLGYDQWV
jgi:hypothetical protein